VPRIWPKSYLSYHDAEYGSVDLLDGCCKLSVTHTACKYLRPSRSCIK
jgi:hypothetical protein